MNLQYLQDLHNLTIDPPTLITLRTVIDRLGGFGPCARLLLMGDNGRRTVRKWYFGDKPIPALCWAVLVACDRKGLA